LCVDVSEKYRTSRLPNSEEIDQRNREINNQNKANWFDDESTSSVNNMSCPCEIPVNA
jgi:hypothetical protein